uniref:Uncharacterized protein n=1 Tax=Anguilla anguilla TaxID=7936 RepID=A0A0E9PX56_ANGAN
MHDSDHEQREKPPLQQNKKARHVPKHHHWWSINAPQEYKTLQVKKENRRSTCLWS